MGAIAAQIRPEERRALVLACLCNFVLLASYYVLRPVRDTMATVIGTARLQELFIATFLGTLLASPIYAALASRVSLKRLLPGVFWFWLSNVLLFSALLGWAPVRETTLHVTCLSWRLSGHRLSGCKRIEIG